MEPEFEPQPETPDPVPLTAEELWLRYRETGDKRLEDQIVERHQALVRFIAERICRGLPHSIDVDDLIQEGTFGLIDAIGKFDPERGVKFKTYCSTRIRGAILDALRTQDWVPRLVRQRAAKLAQVRQAWLARYGCEPTDSEIAKALQVDESDLPKMMPKTRPVSILFTSDRRLSSQGDAEADIDTLSESGEENPLDRAKRRDLMEVLTRTLTPKERRILELYYHEGLTLREIGLQLGLTESRVCQIHSYVIKRLRERIDPSLGA